jgi:glucokinase
VPRLLAADVGGTKVLLAVVELDGQAFEFVRQDRFESSKYSGLGPILRNFIKADDELSGACLAIAGPIDGDVSDTTNLPWIIRGQELANSIGLPRVTMINDFAAVGWGIPHLGPSDVATLQEGKPQKHGPIAYLGAGTGLGQGFMTWNAADQGYDVFASEGGHADFAARDEVEFAVQRWLARQFGHVSYERLISGMGLVAIYRALVEELGRPESPEVAAEMKAEDPAAVISRRGLGRSDGTCGEALDRFVSIYGAEAGNMALRLLATGGLYVAGGIAPRIVERLRAGGFLGAFNDKGRLSPLCAATPVHVVLNTQVGLLGAAACAARALTRSSS